MSTLAEELKERDDILESDKWNVEALYPTLSAWQAEFETVCRPSERPHWPEIAAFKGKLGDGAKTLKDFFNLSFSTERQISKLYTYAHMRHDEDLANEDYKKAHQLISTIYYEFAQELAWAEPEILALSDKTLEASIQDPELADYRFYLERIVRLKSHTLSSQSEELIALAGKALGTAPSAFSAFNNADLKFPSIKDSEGKSLELTHGKYLLYMRSKDREVRKNAFETMHRSFLGFENMIAELFNGHMQNHVFNKRARKYSSCLEASLFPNQIDTKVYTNLVQTVRKGTGALHRYMQLRKKALKVDQLHFYDLYVPLVENVDLRYDYKTAESMVIESVAPLGKEYQSILKKGLEEERWVDRYENRRKRSGAYSTGSYDTMPYILMNFQGGFHDLMTLAHEAGHSMHSYLSHKHQPYQYSSYPIFLAEVASTFNEELMFDYLMKQNLKPEEKAFLINQKIEDIRATFFRQTMFAEFELTAHKLAEDNVPLTPGLLKETYRKLNADFFGPEVELDKEIEIEWGRIPHFYSNFYVYQYATGISAAHALFEKVTTEGESAKEAYLNFLSSGSSKYPLDLLQSAGVNMREEQPIEATLKQFDRLVQELSKLI